MMILSGDLPRSRILAVLLVVIIANRGHMSQFDGCEGNPFGVELLG